MKKASQDDLWLKHTLGALKGLVSCGTSAHLSEFIVLQIGFRRWDNFLLSENEKINRELRNAKDRKVPNLSVL